GCDRGGDRSCRSYGRSRENPVAPARPAVRDHRTDGGAGPPARSARSGMIRYALACDNGHAFESWFQNSAACDKQVKAGLFALPVFHAGKVEKTIMAPGGVGGEKRGEAPLPERPPSPAPSAEAAPCPVAMLSPQEREFRKKLKELRDHLVKNADYVGQKFPEEARKMHYGEIEHRSIYGEASPDQAKELHEEG